MSTLPPFATYCASACSKIEGSTRCVREHHEGELRWIEVGGLLRSHGLQHKRRPAPLLPAQRQSRAPNAYRRQRARTARARDRSGARRNTLASSAGKASPPSIAHLATVEAVAHIERRKVDSRAAVGRNIDFARGDRLCRSRPARPSSSLPECRSPRPPLERANAWDLSGRTSSAGASTLSTVQFGGAAPCATGCNTSFTLLGNTMSAKLAGIARALHIAEQVKIDGPAHRLRKCADGAAEFAKVRVAVARLDALESRAQLRIVGDRLRQHSKLAAESHDLRFLRTRLRCQSGQACCFASANRVPARMLKELSSTMRSRRPFASAARAAQRDWQMRARPAAPARSAARTETRCFSRRCRVELCVPRSKNISELTGRGVVTWRRSRCTKTGTPSAASPPRNHGARKPISYLPAAAQDIRAAPDREADR